MEEFLDNIINYLKTEFENDAEISETKKPQVLDAYKVGNTQKATQPEVQVQILDTREQTNYTTLCGKRAINIPLQITAYCGTKIKFGGIEKNVQRSSIKLAEKIVKYIDKLIYAEENYGIRYARHISSSPALPMRDNGSMYMTAVRYDFIVQE